MTDEIKFWKVSCTLAGVDERIVRADSRDGAWKEYCKRQGVIDASGDTTLQHSAAPSTHDEFHAQPVHLVYRY
jgi:hypothetical protein